MDIERAFRAPFLDTRWAVKMLGAALWSGLIVTSPAVTGYSLDYIRNVAQGYETPLPEWNREFGRWWVRGFFVGLAGFVYMLPALVLLAIGAVPMISALALSDGSDSALGAAAALGGGSLCLTTIVAVIYVAGVSVFFYAAEVNFAFSEDFASLFRVSEIYARLRTDGSGYFGAWGMSLVISLAAGMVAGVIGSILGGTVVLSFVSPFAGGAVGFLAVLMSSHLLGQYAARAYGFPGLAPAAPAVPGYTASYGVAVPPPYAPAPPAAPAPVTTPYPAAPQQPTPPVIAPETPVAETQAAPTTPASSAHSEPDSPTPSHSPEQTAPPSDPATDPPAEDGGA